MDSYINKLKRDIESTEKTLQDQRIFLNNQEIIFKEAEEKSNRINAFNRYNRLKSENKVLYSKLLFFAKNNIYYDGIDPYINQILKVESENKLNNAKDS